jgi:GAF domain-containing protein/ActR/RegA family two-component response regulator
VPRETARPAASLRALGDVAVRLAALAKTDALLQSLPGEAARLLGVDRAVFRLLEEDELVLSAAADPEDAHAFRPRIRVGDGVAGHVLAQDRAVVIRLDTPPDDLLPEAIVAWQRRPATHALGLPVRCGTRATGVLCLYAARPLGEDEVALADAFAAHVAVALEYGGLRREAAGRAEAADTARREAEQRSHRLTGLLAITRSMTSAAERDTVFNAVAAAATELLGAKMARVWVADATAAVLRARGGHGIDAESERAMTDVSEIPFARGVVGAVFASGRPQYVADVQDDPRWYNRRLAREAGLHTYLGLPLIVGDRAVGVLSILFGERRPHRAEDEHLATLLASQAAVAIDNASLYDAVEVRARRLTLLSRLARLVSSSLDRAVVLDGIARAAAELVKAPLVHIWLADDAGAALEIVASSRGPGDGSVGGRVAMGEGAAGFVASRRTALEIPDVLDDERFVNREWARREGIRAFYGVPIVLDEELLGVLVLLGRQPFRVAADDHELLDTFVGHAAVAMRNARLYREARESAERRRALESVNRLVSASLDVEDVLTNLARAAAQFFDAMAVSVWTVDPVTGRIERSLFQGDPALASALRTSLAPGEGIVGWCVAHREPIVWADGADDLRAIDGDRLLASGLRYFTVYPIAIADRVLGAFVVHRTSPAPVAAETPSLLGSLAAQAAVALDHARLYSETTRRLEQTAALLEVAEILSSTLETRELLKRVAVKVARVCRVDRCSVQLWDGDRVVPLMSQFADGRQRPDLWQAFHRLAAIPPRDVPAHARAMETRRPVVIDDAAGTDQLPRAWLEAFAIKSYMVVPLVRQDGVIGVMTLDHCDRTTPFASWQADLALTIAGQLALAIENTRLYGEVRERLRETSTLLAVGRLLSEPGPPDEVMRKVAREVGRAFGADMVVAYFVDDRREHLVPLAGYHVPRDLIGQFRDRSLRMDRFPALAEVWRAGRAVWSADAHADPRWRREWIEGVPPHSVALASATAHGEPVGVLFCVWWRTGRVFTESEIRLLEAVARQVGLAMENADLARQREARLRETEALLSVSRALTSTLDLPSLLRALLRHVNRAIEADSVGVWTLGADGESLEPVAGYRVPPPMVEAARRVRVSVTEPFYGEAARTRRAVVSTDVPSDARISERMKRLTPHRSQLFVPIVVHDRMIGGFAAIWWERAREVAEGELALLEAIANQAGVAIEHARLFQENRRQLDELRALHELSRAVTGELDRATLLGAVHARVAQLFEVRDVAVVVRAEDGDALDVAFLVRDGELDGSTPRRRDASPGGLVPVVMQTGDAIRTDDYLGECRRRGVEPFDRSDRLRHWLGVPMRAGDTVLGAIAVRHADRVFTDQDERLLRNIADLAALALRSARLFEERTRAYEQLAAAQDQLVRTEKLRALGEMASGVAHDFNNLLAAILGRTQVALRSVQDAKLRQWFGFIERAALDGARTVRRLQDFTRIRRDEPFVAVDLNTVAHDALDITQSRWRDEPRSRGVTIQVHTRLADVPRVAGDAAELREALTNLILNAVDAMPHGGTLSIATACVGTRAELTVADSGIGMPDSVKGRAFDPFFTTKGPGGTGLGLSITYGILSRHGVAIDLASTEGQGTTFRLLFPAASPVGASLAAAVAQEAAPGRALTCLVIDDDAAVGGVIADMLESIGHRAVVTRDGAAGLARFEAEPFDVVFTDLAMPGMSGWDVARAVKAHRPGVPVVMVTGFGVELTDDARRAHGIAAVIAKPLRIEDVAAVLAQAAGDAAPHD